MKKISNTQKIAAVAVVTLLVSVGVYVFFFKHISVLHDELYAIEKEVFDLESIIKTEQEIKMLLNDTKEDRNILKEHLVSLEDPTLFLQAIERAAVDAGVSLEIEKVDVVDLDVDSEMVKKELVVNFTTTGSWEEVYRLISLLETMSYATTVMNARVAIEEGDSVSKWSGNIQLHSLAK